MNGEYSSAFINGIINLKDSKHHEIKTKVNHLEKDKVKKVFVFSGDFNVTPEYPYNTNDSKSIFTENELKAIKDDSIPVEIFKYYLL